MELERGRVCDDLQVPGDELGKPGERSLLDHDPRRCEHDLVGRGGRHVSGLAVQRLPALVQGAEALLVAGERPVASVRTPPRAADLHRKVHGQRVLTQRPPDARSLDGSASEREHGRPFVLQGRDRRLRLEHTELDLAALLEELRDRLTHGPLELPVEVHEPAPEKLRELGAELALARAHEPDQRDVPV